MRPEPRFVGPIVRVGFDDVLRCIHPQQTAQRAERQVFVLIGRIVAETLRGPAAAQPISKGDSSGLVLHQVGSGHRACAAC